MHMHTYVGKQKFKHIFLYSYLHLVAQEDTLATGETLTGSLQTDAIWLHQNVDFLEAISCR